MKLALARQSIDTNKPIFLFNFAQALAMASSNINEPFVLATYHSTLRGNLNPRLGAFASVHQISDKYVTVAAQADGVHILDVRIYS